MQETKVSITNPMGLHARPASQLVDLAKQYQSVIQIVKGNVAANCISIVKVLSCNVSQGDEIILRAEGPDEEEAMRALLAFLNGLEE